MKIEIKFRFSGKVLFSHEAENNSIKITVEAAVKARADLAGAYLARADLAGADLAGADLADKSKLIGKRPVFQIGPIGSRCAYFVAYLTDKGIRLRAGCFFGSRDEFETRLIESGEVTQKEYRAALSLIDTHAELWTPVAGDIKEAA